MPGAVWKVLEKLAVIGSVATLIALAVTVIKKLTKHNVGHAIEQAIPTLGVVMLGFFMLAGAVVIMVAIFEHDSTREMFGIMAFGAALVVIPLAILFIGGIHTLGWFGLAYLGATVLSLPSYVARQRAAMCPVDGCHRRAPHGARFCPYCGTTLTTGPT